ncbi:MAG: methyltransferase domain-containing protein [Bacteroidetes bacterium]|nr:methyltransferase domain-containing protein [Bacteroidota bacterium]MBS1974248.1 methyltransferase domain-containing protein [Bacteroidota bacterium]
MIFFSKDKKTAFESKKAAQWIAYGPVIFQVAKALRDLGILEIIEKSGKKGIALEEISEKAKLSQYGVRVLLESALSAELVTINNGKYTNTKTGYFILHDPLTKVNMDFVNDICYKGLFHLEDSVKTGKPAGLRELGNWPTIYEGVAHLPEKLQQSWFNFDHFFSDDAFPIVLPLVYKHNIKNLLDIGGNTGKWAMASVGYNKEVHVSIMDLPGPTKVARQKVDALNLGNRISFVTRNLLEDKTPFPKGFDAIWMSQFLDCFSEDDIVSILKRCYDALNEEGMLFILEPFWDRQKFEVAAFCLQQTSIYFTALANGKSQMYSAATFLPCVEKAGFEVVEETDNIGLSQTLLKCRKRLKGK